MTLLDSICCTCVISSLLIAGFCPPVRLAERRPLGLDPVLQQRSIAQVFVALTEDVRILFEELVELLLLERGEILW